MSFEHLQKNIAEQESKQEKYEVLLEVVKSFVEGNDHPISKLSNIVATIHETLCPLWTGFYVVIGNTLHLFPFQGPLACTRIAYGKGVCGQSWAQNKLLLVEDVEKFPGHIACSSRSRSEIVVPIHAENSDEVVAILDIDSDKLAYFDNIDAKYLALLCQNLSAISWQKLTSDF